MKADDPKLILDDLLSRWHFHCKHYNPLPSTGADPMFRNAVSAKGWDTTADIADDTLNATQMQAIDFHVSELKDPYRAAIHILARNCYTGRSVWHSPRLPQDLAQRVIIVADARAMLQTRLIRAGVM